MRYFRASEEVYEQTRLTLDQAWGLPDGTGTQTCYMPAANAPRDAHGKLVLAISDEFCEYSVAKDMLPQLLASGAVEEIDEATYWAAMPQVTAPASSLPSGSMTINGGLGGLKLGG